MIHSFPKTIINALLVTFAGLIFRGSPAQASGLIRADGAYFRDSQGRAVLLRGVDVSNSEKIPPFDPMPDLSLVQKMKDWGINNIRLAFIWEAFEPEEGQYNFDYLDKLSKVVDAAGKAGINTVIDFHTDGFSRYSIGGCGSGFPKWTLPPDVRPHNPGNGKSCTLWPLEATLEDLLPFSGYYKSTKAFYSDTYGVRTRFLMAWSQIAHHFKNDPNVIGYDLLNEPWGDEKKELAPLYEDVARAIRSEDPQAILMLEPYAMAGVGQPSSLVKPSFSNFAYAPHDYDPIAIGLKAWFTGGLFINSAFEKIQATAARLDAPVYLGEYGASGNGIRMKNLTHYYYDLFDANFISSAQWDLTQWSPEKKDGWDSEDLSIVDENEKLRENFIVRPYPIAVAGDPGAISENYPQDSGEKKLSFIWNNQASLGSTVFFIPRDTMGGSPFTVSFESNDSELNCVFDSINFMLSCASPTDGNKNIEILIRSVL